MQAIRAISRALPKQQTVIQRWASSTTWHKPAISVEFNNVKQAKVEDVVVNITFVNYAGVRTKLPGRVGDSLLEVARRYKYEHVDAKEYRGWMTMVYVKSNTVSVYLSISVYTERYLHRACGGGGSPSAVLHEKGNWYEPKYGEGPQCHYCHVIIPRSHYNVLPPKQSNELERLQDYPFPEDMTDTSRLACQVKITKDMDGMLVYIPDGPPSDIP